MESRSGIPKARKASCRNDCGSDLDNGAGLNVQKLVSLPDDDPETNTQV